MGHLIKFWSQIKMTVKGFTPTKSFTVAISEFPPKWLIYAKVLVQQILLQSEYLHKLLLLALQNPKSDTGVNRP